MRIAMIHESEYVPFRWPRFTLMARALHKLGHEVSIYAFGPCRGNEEGIGRVEIHGGVVAYALSAAIHALSRRVVFAFGLTLELIRRLNKSRPDVIVYHYAHVGISLMFAKRLFGWKSLLIYDWNDLGVRMRLFPNAPRLVDRIWLWLEERTVPRISDHIVVVTEFARRMLISDGIPIGKVTVINELVPLKLDLGAIRARKERKAGQRILIWHGYVRPYQVPGLKSIIEALAQVPPAIRPKFAIVGPFQGGGVKEDLERMADERGVAIDLCGYVDRPRLSSLLDEADVGIQLLPDAIFSRFINGVKLAEYIAHGLPVICSDLDGPSELVDGNGLLVKPHDPAEVASAITRILSDSYQEFVDKSVRRAVEEFSEESVCKKVGQLMEVVTIGPT